jgi:NADH-quinone oxidoreductase subunit L
MFDFMPLVILFPLLGLLANMLFGRWLRQPAAGLIAATAAGLSFAVAIGQGIALLFQPEGVIITLGNWIQVGNLTVPWAFQIDTLSVTMMLVVTGVGTLIHIYAIGYMHGDDSFTRFFVYLNLFLVAMLVLVTAANYLLMFVGWEGVGLCSYLLIGFWFDRGEGGGGNATAGRKAFIVNRVGDAGLILAMGLIFWHFGSLSFLDVFAQAEATLTVGAPIAMVITLLLLLGATGKSAQIPLLIWLPDAMAGPTPVSALIHAATMVTAGIYLMVRSHLLFALAPVSQTAVALIGATTALLAATIAIGQFDIKRVLAYSTISQLGFMVAAVGLGAYVAAIFHLITHAFFKALLFLAAGSVIHGLEASESTKLAKSQTRKFLDFQDMRVMGGLWRRMPLTFGVYVIGALALAGIPPLSGFFSKDEILADALAHNTAVYILLTLAAFCTAFYMGRQVRLVFMGKARTEAAVLAHESPPIMTIPLIILAIVTIIGGGLNLPGIHSLGHWLEHTLGQGETAVFNPLVAATATLLALVALGLAYRLYARQPSAADGDDPLARRLGPLFIALNHQWWLEEGVQLLFVRPYRRLSTFLAKVDDTVFLWLEQGVMRLTDWGTVVLRMTQTGQLNWNVAGIVGGLIFVLLLLLIGELR